jgi:hypothetical protein
VIRLLLWKARIHYYGFFRTRRAWVKAGLLFLFGVAWATGVFYGSFALFKALKSGKIPDAALLPGDPSIFFLGLIYAGGLFISFFSMLQAAFDIFYTSPDLPLLASRPVTPNRLFTLKFAELWLAHLPLALVLVLPAAWGYGASGGAWWGFYPAAFLLTLLIVFLAAGLVALGVLLIVRLVRPHRQREIVAAVGALAILAVVALGQLGPVYAQKMKLDLALVYRVTEHMSLSNIGISPVYWLVQATLAAVRGAGVGYLFWAGLTTVAALGVFGASFLLVRNSFYARWAAAFEVHRRRSSRVIRWSRALPDGLWLAGPFRAVAGKEMRQVWRNPQELILTLQGVLIIAISFIVPVLKGENTGLPAGEPWVLYVSLFISYLVVFFVAAPLAASAVSREGRDWLFLRSTPLTGTQILGGKVLGVTALVTGPCLLLAVGANALLGLRDWRLIFIGLFTLLVTPGFTGLGVLGDALYPGFQKENSGRRRMGWGSLLASFLAFCVYGALLAPGILLAVPNWTGSYVWLRLPGTLWLLVVAAAAIALPVAIGGEALDRREAAPPD